MILAAAGCLMSVRPGYAAGRAAVLRSGLPGADSALVDALGGEFKVVGYEVREIDFAGLCDPARLSTEPVDLLVIPEAASLPVSAQKTIEEYLRKGGDIIALGTPMWQRASVQVGETWLTRQQYEETSSLPKPEHVIADFTPESIAGWLWSHDDPDRKTVHETVAEGPAAGARALHVWTEDLSGWDTFGPWKVENPFPDGRTLTAFSAKGGANATQLCIEWREKDGSRWIAVVDLTNEWRDYVLTPEDFLFHAGGYNRGLKGDHFKPENAEGTSVGVAIGITDSDGSKPQEFWVGPYGTAKPSPELADILRSELPALDQLSPTYKLFDCHGVASIAARDDQVIIDSRKFAVPKQVRSPNPRPRGVGFDKGREWRWIPLLEARTAKGEWRGTPATLTVHFAGPSKGGAWASFGIPDSKWYRSAEVIKAIGQVARRMRDSVFIAEGGSNFFTYFEGQPMRLGLRVGNIGRENATGLTARITLISADNGREALRREWPVSIAPGEIATVADDYEPQTWPNGGFAVIAELVRDGRVIDRISHLARVWKPKKQKHFLTIKDGEFTLDGKRWRPHGVNYMTSSGIGCEDYGFYRYWLSAEHYDPEPVQRDLDHIKDLGFNSVSIFLFAKDREAQNLLDFLARLERMGLKANLFLDPSMPKEYQWEPIKESIDYYRIPENDTVFAYDIDWEPVWADQPRRAAWDRQWEAWIVERYGSIENAQKDWGFAVPRAKDGKITNPLDQQLESDGDWRVMVAAYRRFLDTFLYMKYSAVRRLLKGVDPNHLVSFRMSDGGNPTLRRGGWLTYDFPGVAGAVDFLSPEANGRIGIWDRTAPGWFEFEYARWAKPNAPMMWAEVGGNSWNPYRMIPSPVREDFAAECCRNFYKMITSSGASGVYWWYYPGGFRFEEKSDCGIINPDGSDRPITKAIRECGPKFVNGPSAKPVNHWIQFDRDKHPDGIAGIYDAAKDDFWKAIAAGQVPGLRTAGTGTDSSNCPLIAVGNTPCSGTNPPKYLDGALDSVEVLAKDGKWTPVEKGRKVIVNANVPVIARLTLTNLGEAKWATQGAGAVSVVAGDERTPLPKPVAHLGSITLSNVRLAPAGARLPADVTLTLDAQGRTAFGEKFAITLVD